ncbi:HTH domain-containing protein [Rossellomorea vietnamensis]|uniref:HTH domain-containing protein n=1 Tax=Rossellomorea vietnamensis TaxID=218284 RepID=UPI002078A9B4|nr:HTH domain-containing protein [Rossellomorea vietnamensis]
MTINRHSEIIYRLLDRKVFTAKKLAEHFKVSTIMIYRDVDVESLSMLIRAEAEGFLY